MSRSAFSASGCNCPRACAMYAVTASPRIMRGMKKLIVMAAHAVNA
jgi:hypothetical protein